jgi:prepilin-type N-terminal cleavage/methylation domain-containing protein
MMLKYTHANASINNSSSQKGFTLIELSIVLVVIGLIVSGITSGASLIKQATLRSVIAEVRNYQLSINTFVLTYGALPGDFNTNGTALSAAVAGDGDGLVNGNEYQTAFQMLGLASLINANFASSSYPKSKYSGTEYVITNNASSVYGKADNSITLRAISAVVIGSSTGAVTPGDAQNIDAKIDDGVAYKGTVYASKSFGVSTLAKCTKSATLSTLASPTAADDYALTDLTPTCLMYFWISN